jgi:hypothetical protein
MAQTYPGCKSWALPALKSTIRDEGQPRTKSWATSAVPTGLLGGNHEPRTNVLGYSQQLSAVPSGLNLFAVQVEAVQSLWGNDGWLLRFMFCPWRAVRIKMKGIRACFLRSQTGAVPWGQPGCR